MVKVNAKRTGDKIRHQMAIADIDSKELANQLGYADRSTVNRWTRGESIPSYENLVNLSIVLKCKIKDLVEFNEEN